MVVGVLSSVESKIEKQETKINYERKYPELDTLRVRKQDMAVGTCKEALTDSYKSTLA